MKYKIINHVLANEFIHDIKLVDWFVLLNNT